jgi:hypothetical protein
MTIWPTSRRCYANVGSPEPPIERSVIPRWTATESVIDTVLTDAHDRPPLLGGGRMICIDGPAGAGKTTLSLRLVHAAAASGIGTRVVHLDDTYAGWEQDLSALGSRLRDYLVGPLASGHMGRYHRFDWQAGKFAEWVTVAPTELLVLEGVGSGNPQIRSRRATLVWVEADRELCLTRGLARDGEAMREHWLGWQTREAEYFARHETASQADVRIISTNTP